MYKKLLLIPFIIYSSLVAKTVKPKDMHAKDTKYESHYDNSLNRGSTKDRVVSSTAEASAQITVTVTLQITTELTSGRTHNSATISFLDNNRVKITEDIAKGEGEHLKTLLTMLEITPNEENLRNIQNNFDSFIHLSHNDFLNKLKNLNL